MYFDCGKLTRVDSKISSNFFQLAQAGFEMTDAKDSAARCVCCGKDMEWESTDDPL